MPKNLITQQPFIMIEMQDEPRVDEDKVTLSEQQQLFNPQQINEYRLPNELWEYILSFTDYSELKPLRASCKFFQTICDNREVWLQQNTRVSRLKLKQALDDINQLQAKDRLSFALHSNQLQFRFLILGLPLLNYLILGINFSLFEPYSIKNLLCLTIVYMGWYLYLNCAGIRLPSCLPAQLELSLFKTQIVLNNHKILQEDFFQAKINYATWFNHREEFANFLQFITQTYQAVAGTNYTREEWRQLFSTSNQRCDAANLLSGKFFAEIGAFNLNELHTLLNSQKSTKYCRAMLVKQLASASQLPAGEFNQVIDRVFSIALKYSLRLRDEPREPLDKFVTKQRLFRRILQGIVNGFLWLFWLGTDERVLIDYAQHFLANIHLCYFPKAIHNAVTGLTEIELMELAENAELYADLMAKADFNDKLWFPLALLVLAKLPENFSHKVLPLEKILLLQAKKMSTWPELHQRGVTAHLATQSLYQKAVSELAQIRPNTFKKLMLSESFREFLQSLANPAITSLLASHNAAESYPLSLG